MKAMILAAGLGTRLRPWTLSHPKALVEVGGVPMLRRVADRLREEGFDDIMINVHHFADQIVDYVAASGLEGLIRCSEEEILLDTAGGIGHALPLLFASGEDDVLVHNVDILSNAPLRLLMERHKQSGADVTLLVSPRESSRELIFDNGWSFKGWHNRQSGQYRPDTESAYAALSRVERAFSGIYVVSPKAIAMMHEAYKGSALGLINFMLDNIDCLQIKGVDYPSLKIIDIGKPETLAHARSLFVEDM